MVFLSYCGQNHRYILPLHFITASLLTMLQSMKTQIPVKAIFLSWHLLSCLY